MKIYTKTGDKGTTSLVGGRRVNKSDSQIDAYGTSDELNSMIGLFRSYDLPSEVDEVLLVIQKDLFTVGGFLASDFSKEKTQWLKTVELDQVEYLENKIDLFSENLPPLKSFILPAGSRIVALAHVCRTVTRRLERVVTLLCSTIEMDDFTLKYINRLSDLFFVLARYLAKNEEIEIVL